MILPFRLTICGLPELPGQARKEVSHVLSILDPEHPVPEAFAAYGAHEKLELRFDDVIEDLPGKAAPGAQDVAALLAFGRDVLPPAHLLVHCHAGVSRSSACAALILAQAEPRWTGDEIFAALLSLRPQIWPNLRLLELGDAALGRGGALVAAAGRLYARQIEGNHDLIFHFTGMQRTRELAAAFAAGALAGEKP